MASIIKWGRCSFFYFLQGRRKMLDAGACSCSAPPASRYVVNWASVISIFVYIAVCALLCLRFYQYFCSTTCGPLRLGNLKTVLAEALFTSTWILFISIWILFTSRLNLPRLSSLNKNWRGQGLRVPWMGRSSWCWKGCRPESGAGPSPMFCPVYHMDNLKEARTSFVSRGQRLVSSAPTRISFLCQPNFGTVLLVQ